MQPLSKLRSYIQSPVHSIACVLSGGIGLYGLLLVIGVAGNWFHSEAGSPDFVVYFFGVLFFLAGASFIWAYVKENLNAANRLMYVFVCYLTIFLSRITREFYPITWMAPLLCAVITALIYIWLKANARD